MVWHGISAIDVPTREAFYFNELGAGVGCDKTHVGTGSFTVAPGLGQVANERRVIR